MAVPTSYFAQKWGIAVMRYDHQTGEWFFMGWATKRAFPIQVGPGTHTFHLWLINGTSSGNTGVSFNDTATLAVLQGKK